MTAQEKKDHQALLEKLAGLEKTNGELKHQVVSLQSELEGREEVLRSLQLAKDEQEKESLELIQELQEKADKKETKAALGHTAKISVAGEEDRVFVFTTGAFSYEAVKYKATDITDNHPILLELVKIGAGVLQEVTE